MIGIPSPGSTGKEANRAESRTKAVFDYCTRGEYLLTLLAGNRIFGLGIPKIYTSTAHVK